MASGQDMESDAEPYSDLAVSDISRLLSRIGLQDVDHFVKHYFDLLPPYLKVECYDVMILHHDEEHSYAEKLKQHISTITLKNNKILSAALHNGPEFMSLSGSEFDNLEEVFNRCTFTFVLLSKLFVKDTWCKLISQGFLMNMLSDENKSWCVVPVLPERRNKLDFKIPLHLIPLQPIIFKEPFDMFNQRVCNLVSDRYNKRMEIENYIQQKRVEYLKDKVDQKCSPEMNNIIAPPDELAGGKHVDNMLPKGDNFCKKINDKDYIRNRRIVTKASYSVGIIRGPGTSGTGFRVGDKYVMTALHVVDMNIRAIQGLYKGDVDYTYVRNGSFYIEFEFLKKNQKQEEKHLFNFIDLVYKNTNLDTAILELRIESENPPPEIRHFGSPPADSPVYLIGHPKEEPMMDDPKIEMYEICKEDIDKSNEWAKTRFPKHGDINWYEELNDNNKILFHCASQHGASGALGIMVDPCCDEPVGTLMLLRGFPTFYYLKDHHFTEEEKDNFLIVEQGVFLKSIAKDMDIDSEFPKTPELKKQIFGHIERR